MGVLKARIGELVKDSRSLGPDHLTVPGNSIALNWVLEVAAQEAVSMRQDYVGTEHLLLALLSERDLKVANVLELVPKLLNN
jgi:ATP-dependent Clp protease ATP-binding subunit ClpA